jgi:hypothetical protein
MFNRLSHDALPEGIRHRNDCLDDGKYPRLVVHGMNEAAVELNCVNGKPVQQAQTGLPCAEVVERNADSSLAQLLQFVATHCLH